MAVPIHAFVFYFHYELCIVNNWGGGWESRRLEIYTLVLLHHRSLF